MSTVKEINDLEGHSLGDEVLIELTQRVSSGVKEYDLLCRWGGEELLVLLAGDRVPIFLKVAERLRQTIENAPMSNRGISVTVSGGLTTWEPDEPLKSVVERADAFLYRAKEAGRNRIAHELF